MVEYSGGVCEMRILPSITPEHIVAEGIAGVVCLTVSGSVDVMSVLVFVPYVVAKLFHYVVAPLGHHTC